MPFEKGNKLAGSRKGSPNKFSGEIKEMIRHALDNVGGVDYLEKQAEENPVAFMGLVAKVMPSEVNAKLNGAIKVDGTVNFIRKDHKV